MKAVVKEAMEQGAMGPCASRYSNHRSAGAPAGAGTGGKSTVGMTGDLAPGYFATDGELIEMAKTI